MPFSWLSSWAKSIGIVEHSGPPLSNYGARVKMATGVTGGAGRDEQTSADIGTSMDRNHNNRLLTHAASLFHRVTLGRIDTLVPQHPP